MTGDERRTSDGDESGDGNGNEPPAPDSDSDPDPDPDSTPTPDPDDAEDPSESDAEDAGSDGTDEDDEGGKHGSLLGDDPRDRRESEDGIDEGLLPSDERYGERREAEFPGDPDRSADPDAGDDDSGTSVTRVNETGSETDDPDPEGAAVGADSDADVEWADERDPEADPEIDRDGAETDADADGDEDAVQSDGGAAVGSASASTEAAPSYEDGFVDTTDEPLEGPASDEEMPLADHIEEMVSRLGVVILAMSIVSVLALPFSVDMINFIWYSILGSVQDVPTEPRIYRPLALVLARLKVATLVGFVAALPVFVYETYLFMRPGLYQHERRYYLAAVPTSLVLAFIGVAFAFYLVLPALFTYFVSYTVEAAGIAFGLTDTFGLMLLMMGFFAAVFQIPLLIMLAVMMGLTTRRWLVDRRLYFWGGFLGVALLFSPDPTGMAPIIVALTMVGLFEATLLLLRWTNR